MDKRVLVVEDDPGILGIIEILLREEKYEVETSATGKDVLNLIENFNPQLILMDIRLGELDGREICSDIRKSDSFADIPVILMSAHAMRKDIVIESCADDFISKPFDIEDLLKRVRNCISKQHNL